MIELIVDGFLQGKFQTISDAEAAAKRILSVRNVATPSVYEVSDDSVYIETVKRSK